MDVSKNSGTPKSSILIAFSLINQPFWGPPIFGNTYIWTLDDIKGIIAQPFAIVGKHYDTDGYFVEF